MPKRKDIQKILIIGSGPIVIGQAGECDHAATQACAALRSLGYSVVMVDSDPTAIMTDPGIADVSYVEPLNVKVLTEIIAAEHPDALLSTVGGQSGLNLGVELHHAGVLTDHGVLLIGTAIEAIEQSENRSAFKEAMVRLGFEVPTSEAVGSVDDAARAAETIGFPVVIRPSFTMGGEGGGLVYNQEELRVVAGRGLSASRIQQVLVEASILGWQELELAVVRDAQNQIITVGGIETVDAMGVHSGDSIGTTPMLTVSAELQQRLQADAHAIAEAFQIIGAVTIRFARDPQTDRVAVIEINPRTSRSSALVSKVTGVPIARVSALLAGGLTLDEIPDRRCGTLDRYRQSENGVAVRLPLWAFDKFDGVEDRLGTQMRSVGAAVGIGSHYKEAFQKAVRSLSLGRLGLGYAKDFNTLPLDTLLQQVAVPNSERPFQMYEALRKGAAVRQLAALTHINPWFIDEMKTLVALEEQILALRGGHIPEDLLAQAKKDGFADGYLAQLLGFDASAVRRQRSALNITPAWQPVPVRDASDAVCCYATYNTHDAVPTGSRRKIMVLGSGPTHIGQGVAYDYCCVHAIQAVREAGVEAIMVNCNPESVSTAPNIADKCYVDPLTVEDVLNICEKEHPEGVIIQFGGLTPLTIAKALAAEGVPILGSAPDTIDLAEDRDRFRRIVRGLGIPQPESAAVDSTEQALAAAERFGYPLMVSPCSAADGRGAAIVHDHSMLTACLDGAAAPSPQRPLRIDQFLDNAIEAEADAVADAKDAFVPAVMEHVELAGIHAGDSACVIPPISLAPKHLDTIREFTRRIAVELGVVGLMNIQYAIYENTVYVLKAALRASRTVPLVSKVCGHSLASIAARVMMGHSLSEMGLEAGNLQHFGVKEAVFPFHRFPEVDPLLGPEMRSTGEVLGLSRSFGRAFFKSQEATQTALPLEGAVLFTIADRDKHAAIEPVRRFRELGFTLMATDGTHRFLRDQGIDTIPVSKLGYRRPNLVDAIKSGQVQLLVNTPSGGPSAADSSDIRRAAIKYRIPYITTTAAALAAANGIAARRKGTPKVRPLQHYHADSC